MVCRPCCGMSRSSQRLHVWRGDEENLMVRRNLMMRTLMVKVMMMVRVMVRVMRRTLMVRKSLMVKTDLAHSPLMWTLSRLFSWVQDTGIPSLSDKIFHIDMFHCVQRQHKGSYLHILTVGATSLAHVTFGLPRIAL